MTRPESNGGVSCPDLHQDRKCRGSECARQTGRHRKHDNSAIRGQYCREIELLTRPFYPESAMILPAKYSKVEGGVYDPRQNLRTYREEENNDQ